MTLSAIVSAAAPGDDVLQNGWAVVFSGTANGGWTSGIVYTADGEAVFQHTSPLIGNESVTARVVNNGCSGADTVSEPIGLSWWFPTISLDRRDSVSVTGGSFTLIASVTHDGVPVEGQQLSFRVDQFYPADRAVVDPYTRTTDARGEASVTWTRAAPSAEAITVEEIGPAIPASSGTSHVWDSFLDPGVSITLDPSGGPPRVGSTVNVAVVSSVDEARAATETLLSYSTANPGAGVASTTTSATGTATLSFVTEQPGPEVVVVGLAGRQGSFSVVLKRWAPRLDLSPGGTDVLGHRSRAFTGQSVEVTAILSHDGGAVAGASLTLAARNATLGNLERAAMTDSVGRASFAPWRWDQVSTDLVTVEEDATIAPAVATTEIVWDPPAGAPIAVDLEARAAVVRVGAEVTLGATPTYPGHLPDEAVPLSNLDVSLRETATGPALATTESGVTSGAIFGESRTTSGTRTFVATVDVPGCGRVMSDPVTVRWAIPELRIEPRDTRSPARAYAEVRARLTLDGKGVADARLDFASHSLQCDLSDLGGSGTTDQDGFASVSLRRDVPTRDRVTVREVGVLQPQSDQTTHTWGVPDPSPLVVDLHQSSADDRVGTTVTLTATVTYDDGEEITPSARVPVRFTGTDSGDAEFDTDDQGRVEYTYARSSARTDHITASTPYGCDRVISNDEDHEWWLPTLSLIPDRATVDIGDTASITAQLTHAGQPLAERSLDLTFDSSAAGESAFGRTATTGPDGRATLSWDRGAAGTETITATESAVVAPRHARAIVTWVRTSEPPSSEPPSSQPPSSQPPISEPPSSQPPTSEPPSSQPPTSAPPSSAPPSSQSPTAKPSEQPPPPTSSRLVTGPEVGRPGGDVQIAGTGCRPGQTVTVRLGSTTLGRTRAAADGTFYLRTSIPDLPLGRYVITSSCGTTIGDKNIDITAPQVNRGLAGIAAAGATTASTFVFFVLLIKGVISFLPKRLG
ncbi:hypothetical protein [Microlunatus ginsengisoli]|uniref:hypothetical protein n=1 Tax=Microlunatus ginsengisoli TaxID=363863 RepID=UPI0031D8F129